MKCSIFLLLFALINCSDSYETKTIVKLTQEQRDVKIVNEGPNDVRYFLFESGFAATVNIDTSCDNFKPNIKSGTSISIAFEDIAGYDDDAESFWFSWTDCKISGNTQTIKFDQ